MPLAPQELNKIRLGRLTNIDHATNLCEVRFFDRLGGFRSDIQIAQPYIGRGWGILAGVEIGTVVLVGEEKSGNTRILAYLPHAHFYRDDVNEFLDVTPDESPYRRITTGEIILQSKSNSIVALNSIGDITLETPDGNILELDREADLIFQQSSQREIVSDAGTLNAGVIRRDVRSLEERETDLIFGSSTTLGLDFDVFEETIGVDPQYPQVSGIGGASTVTDSNLIPGLFDPFFPEQITEGRGVGVNISDMLNPAITEWDLTINEFGDGNPGVDRPLLDDRAKARGHIEPNTLAQITLGTVTNEIGRQVRFDYYFGQPDENGKNKGHDKIFASTSNATGTSFDRFFNRAASLKGNTAQKDASLEVAAPGHNVGQEWLVDTLAQAPTAILFKMLLHTKGADNFGRKETEVTTAFRSGDEELISKTLQDSYSGSPWSLFVDKEGLTKWNIPAATNLDGLEPFRAGRSLIANFDGDITLAVGKQKATGAFGLDKVTTDEFTNRNNYPNYGRRDRSITLDTAGNIEARIGADLNVNQSLIVQADGSAALRFGKELGEPQITTDIANVPITQGAKATTRADRSLTAEFEGNAELKIGRDEEALQSVILSTTGGNAFRYGKDIDGKSIEMATEGGIDIQIQGPMNENTYALHIDAKGVLHIKASQNIQIETAQSIQMTAAQNIALKAGNDIQLIAGNNTDIVATNTAKMLGITTNLFSSQGGAALTARPNGVDVLGTTTNINAPGTLNILGSVGVAGQVLTQGPPGTPPLPVARVGDLCQVGPAIGAIVTGSMFNNSI